MHSQACSEMSWTVGAKQCKAQSVQCCGCMFSSSHGGLSAAGPARRCWRRWRCGCCRRWRPCCRTWRRTPGSTCPGPSPPPPCSRSVPQPQLRMSVVVHCCNCSLFSLAGGEFESLAGQAWPALSVDGCHVGSYPQLLNQGSCFRLQAGWQQPEAEWASLSEEDAGTFRSLLAIRTEVNQVTNNSLLSRDTGSSGRSAADCKHHLRPRLQVLALLPPTAGWDSGHSAADCKHILCPRLQMLALLSPPAGRDCCASALIQLRGWGFSGCNAPKCHGDPRPCPSTPCIKPYVPSPAGAGEGAGGAAAGRGAGGAHPAVRG
jgi:hypothetical protein